MDLENSTVSVARILRRAYGEDQVQSTLIVKSTFTFDALGQTSHATEQVPIIEDRLDTAFGVFHTDCFVAKDGVDVCVLGSVRLSEPVTSTRVTLEVASPSNTLERSLTIFGDRHWVSKDLELVASAPAAFTELPLSYAHAFGGVTEHDHEQVAWPDNPLGCGYYLSEERALGAPLPKIEAEAAAHITRWSDQPQVAGWGPYPLYWGLRAREGVDVSQVTPEKFIPRPLHRLNNQAHPALILPELACESVFRLRGVRDEDVWVALPKLELVAEVSVGQDRWEVESRLDGVFIWLDAARVTLSHRLHFNYAYHRAERRCVRLRNATSGS